jgi:hypothetical protein
VPGSGNSAAASLAHTASASPSSRYRTISRSSFISSFDSSVAASPRSAAARARACWSSMNVPICGRKIAGIRL